MDRSCAGTTTRRTSTVGGLALGESPCFVTNTRSALVCDRDSEFRASLCNFLLSAGYSRVEGVDSVREALPRLRSGTYGCVLFALSPPLSMSRWLSRLARARQPEASTIFLIRAADAPLIEDTELVYVFKERAFGSLSELLPELGILPEMLLN
jgi:CheY-like chemotaxis protein